MGVAVAAPVALPAGEADAIAVGAAVGLPEEAAVAEGTADAEVVEEEVSDPVGEAVGLPEEVGVAEGVADAEVVPDPVGNPLGESVILLEELCEGVAEAEGGSTATTMAAPAPPRAEDPSGPPGTAKKDPAT